MHGCRCCSPNRKDAIASEHDKVVSVLANELALELDDDVLVLPINKEEGVVLGKATRIGAYVEDRFPNRRRKHSAPVNVFDIFHCNGVDSAKNV